MATSPTPGLSTLFITQAPSYRWENGSSKQHGGDSQRDHKMGLFMLSFFSMALFLTILYCLYTRWSTFTTTSTATTTDVEQLDRDVLSIGYGGMFPSGLNKKIIDGLPERPHAGAAEDCAICLSKMVVGEMVKIMPGCEHGFHSECVEEWLKAHATCPMCRTYLIAVPAKPKAVVVADPLEMV